MYVMYYASMLQCWQLVRILVGTNHPCLKVGRHSVTLSLIFSSNVRRWKSNIFTIQKKWFTDLETQVWRFYRWW
jgi:hypothetical protein